MHCILVFIGAILAVVWQWQETKQLNQRMSRVWTYPPCLHLLTCIHTHIHPHPIPSHPTFPAPPLEPLAFLFLQAGETLWEYSTIISHCWRSSGWVSMLIRLYTCTYYMHPCMFVYLLVVSDLNIYTLPAPPPVRLVWLIDWLTPIANQKRTVQPPTHPLTLLLVLLLLLGQLTHSLNPSDYLSLTSNSLPLPCCCFLILLSCHHHIIYPSARPSSK